MRFLAAICLACGVACAAPGLAAAYPISSATIWSIAGTGAQCSTPPQCGDGHGATSAALSFPEGVAVDTSGNVYIADWGNNVVRKVSPTGTVSLLAGDGSPCPAAPRCGDGGPATAGELNFPEAVAVDRSGNVYVADTGDNEVRKISTNGTISRFAGNGTPCSSPPGCGDGGAARKAQLNSPGAVAVDASGNVYIADTADDAVREVTRNGKIATVAGDGTLCASPPNCGDGGAATVAPISLPDGVAVGPAGDVYVSDTGDNEVRKIAAASGKISRVAGTGTACTSAPSCGDGGAATSAQLSFPEGLALDSHGTLYISDWGDNEVRAVPRHGAISAVAGNGSSCATPPSCGDGASAHNAELSSPEGLALDAAGDLYIADVFDNEIRWMPSSKASPAAFRGPSGNQVAVVVFGATLSGSKVGVHFALSASAQITLGISSNPRPPTPVAHAKGRAGLGEITWNHMLAGKPAPRRRYWLTITAKIGKRSASSSLRVLI